MREVTEHDYQALLLTTSELVFTNHLTGKAIRIKIGGEKHLEKTAPDNFTLETTTVWSFPARGDWATHKGDYRGNWPPQLARNLILRYTQSTDLVLDQMCGSGTTLIECRVLGRNAIGIDLNQDSVLLTRDRLSFDVATLDPPTSQRTFVGDARNLDRIADESIDFIATHPPYANIIPYSRQPVSGDISQVRDIGEYVMEMTRVALESFRVLKPDHYCAILIGDTRRRKHYVPIAYRVLGAFLQAGFALKEDVIKHQWHCASTPFWRQKSADNNFFLIMHEHLFIFRKPKTNENLSPIRDSLKSILSAV
jgi:DNA modification methylase